MYVNGPASYPEAHHATQELRWFLPNGFISGNPILQQKWTAYSEMGKREYWKTVPLVVDLGDEVFTTKDDVTSAAVAAGVGGAEHA